ncbi:ATPase [Candidatus Bathyarchaeota archaeon]|nr:MAG: ATPase [Candidatus Bathyarchaeota archaeon]
MRGYVIGDEDLALGFRLIGVRGTIALSSDEALKVLRRIIEDEKNGEIIFISEDLSSRIQEELDEIRSKSNSLIIEVPGRKARETSMVQRLISRVLRVRV